MRFLLSENVDLLKKALIAWEILCKSKYNGGLNFLNIHTWNKAALGKLLCNLSKKKDKLWVIWVHSYYGRQNSVWGVQAKQTSWLVLENFEDPQIFPVSWL